jgi:glutathione reductase (NADPH)
MARDFDFDLFTIGAGSGGVAASRRAGSHGARVAICEADRVGGTCVLRGCVPKKLLVYASHLRDELEDAAGYGWSLGGTPTLDWARLIAAKDAELDRLNAIYLRLLASSGVETIEGRGVLVDPHTVEVRGRRYTAERILISTGGSPHVPDVPGAELGITSDEALSLPQVPRRLLVVGGGYIAVELAGVFAGAGSQVTLLVRGYGVLRDFDGDVHAALAEEMQRRGIAIQNHSEVEAVERSGDALVVRCRGDQDHEADVVLWATGRWPNTRGLGLEELGVALDDRGAIIVDEWSRTNVPGVFAVGDATPRPNLTPVAIADGRALAETLFNDNPTKVDHEGVPTAVFSQPQVGTVGLTEKQARDRYPHVDVYRTNFRPMKHILPGRQERAMMKLVVDRDGDRVLGVHMVGPDAAEIIQGFAVALKCGATKKQLDATIGIHPTLAEELVTMHKPVE